MNREQEIEKFNEVWKENKLEFTDYISSRCNYSSEISDILSDVRENILNRIKKGNEPIKDYKKYTFKSLDYRNIDIWRKKQRVSSNEIIDDKLQSDENIALNMERADLLQSLYKYCTDKEAYIIQLRLEGYRHKEIAQLAQKEGFSIKNENSSKAQYYNAIKKIKKNLGLLMLILLFSFFT